MSEWKGPVARVIEAIEPWRTSTDVSIILLLKEIDAALTAPRTAPTAVSANQRGGTVSANAVDAALAAPRPERTYSAEEAAQLQRALAQIEYTAREDGLWRCPECDWKRADGHASDCSVGKVLHPEDYGLPSGERKDGEAGG